MKHRNWSKLLCGSVCVWLMFAGVVGCGARRTIEPVADSVVHDATDSLKERVELVRQGPEAYLHAVLEKCRELEQYTLTFTRQERRGLGFFKVMHEPEVIQCKFRAEPFSVYMKWLDPDIKYGESVYVAGQEGDKVRFVPRNGLFGLPPSITRVGIQTPVIWGEARYPITDFGLVRMMERTFGSIERAEGDWTITYNGLTKLSESERVLHFLRMEFPTSIYKTPIQELFVDVETDLPYCTRILYKSGELEAAYIWADVDPSATLTDDDFLLDAERELLDERDDDVAGEP